MRRIGFCVSLVFAMFCFGKTGYIHAKASLAQVLMEHAWQRSQRLGFSQKPWPWADVMPIAVLSVPSLGIDQYVLDSHAGEALAFGPGMITNRNDSAPVRVLAGHRDTHFRFLQHLQPGALIQIQQIGEKVREFRVSSSEILDVRKDELPMEVMEETLFLVTCYPFNAVSNHGPLRLVFTANEAFPSVENIIRHN